MVEHMPDQRMSKSEGVPIALEKAMTHALFQKVQQIILTQTAHRAQAMQREAIAQKGCERERSPAFGAEPLRAADNRPRHLLGKPKIGWSGGGYHVSTTLSQRSPPHPGMKHLLDE